jgi:hypothetical protein
MPTCASADVRAGSSKLRLTFRLRSGPQGRGRAIPDPGLIQQDRDPARPKLDGRRAYVRGLPGCGAEKAAVVPARGNVNRNRVWMPGQPSGMQAHPEIASTQNINSTREDRVYLPPTRSRGEGGKHAGAHIPGLESHGACCRRAFKAMKTRSGLRGNSLILVPLALANALPIADGTEIMGCSATPRAPKGPLSWGVSMKI